jgi:peptidoglycan/xylan/chitin deacetylase (PgdA/CDA1 family)
VPYGVNIVNCTVPGKLALTLDDGPYLYTSQVLDILKAANVSATFFVVANNGGKGEIDITNPYPSIIRRMILEGHQVGSHSFSHQDLSTCTAQQRHDQIVKNERVLANILGFFPAYLRPPYYDCSVACYTDLLALGYHVVGYAVQDYYVGTYLRLDELQH